MSCLGHKRQPDLLLVGAARLYPCSEASAVIWGFVILIKSLHVITFRTVIQP